MPNNISSVIISILFFSLGSLIYIFSVLQILIVVSCQIRLTRQLASATILLQQNAKIIYRHSLYTIIIHGIIVSLVIILITVFGKTTDLYCFFFGMILLCVTSIRQLGINQINTQEYFKKYNSLIDIEKLVQYFPNLH